MGTLIKRAGVRTPPGHPLDPPLSVNERGRRRIRNVDSSLSLSLSLYLQPGGLCSPSLPIVLYYQVIVVYSLSSLSPRAWHVAEHNRLSFSRLLLGGHSRPIVRSKAQRASLPDGRIRNALIQFVCHSG